MLSSDTLARYKGGAQVLARWRNGAQFWPFTPAPPPAGEALDYDGLLPATLAPSDLPYSLAQHISGFGPVTYSATGLPSGVTINSTGIISGTFTGTASATLVASNGTSPNVSVGVSFTAAAAPTLSLASTDYSSSTTTGTAVIGANAATRRTFVIAQGGGLTASGFSATGGSVTLVSADTYSLRYVEANEVTGITAETVAWSLNAAGNTFALGWFRSLGYKPLAVGDPFVSNRRTANDATTHSVSVTVPVGGAVCFFGVKYNTITWGGPGSPTTVATAAAGAGGMIRGVWENTTGAPQTFSITFALTSGTSIEKYCMALILEAI